MEPDFETHRTSISLAARLYQQATQIMDAEAFNSFSEYVAALIRADVRRFRERPPEPPTGKRIGPAKP